MNTLETLQYMQLKFRDAEPGFNPSSDSSISRAACRILTHSPEEFTGARFWAQETLDCAMGMELNDFQLRSCLGTIAEAIEQINELT